MNDGYWDNDPKRTVRLKDTGDGLWDIYEGRESASDAAIEKGVDLTRNYTDENVFKAKLLGEIKQQDDPALHGRLSSWEDIDQVRRGENGFSISANGNQYTFSNGFDYIGGAEHGLRDSSSDMLALLGTGKLAVALIKAGVTATKVGIIEATRKAAGSGVIRAAPIGLADDLLAYAPRVKTLPGVTDVYAHASVDAFSILHNGKWVSLSHRDMAGFLKSQSVTGDLRLISCSAGQGRLAQDLANKVGRNVTAASDTVWIYPNGNLTVGPSATANTGFWKTFKPGN